MRNMREGDQEIYEIEGGQKRKEMEQWEGREGRN